jgi:aerotaxis receptor
MLGTGFNDVQKEQAAMRKNEPVTQQEYILPEDATLLSVTDPKGRILLANSAFVEASGFTREQLLGKAHNIVRHPDMPQAAFADLWKTLKAGIPWTGLVKNRRANGDHYWVSANVTPVQRDGSIVGYVSVRTTPSRTQIAGAESLYGQINNGTTGLRIEQGVVVRGGWLRWLSVGRVAPVRLRMAAVLAMAVLPALALLPLLGLGAGQALGVSVALGVGALLSFALGEHQLCGPLQQVARQAQAAAGGQTRGAPELARTDAIGMLVRSINQMAVNQAAIISDVRARIEGLLAASSEIAQGNTDLSTRTEQQASNLEMTAASMEQMAAAVKATSEAATHANELAISASRAAIHGGEIVGQVTAKMEQIAEASRRISDIISVIDGIAFQTNILALNAAVEAARAGEQGRGFAVVASEVRMLAQRSAGAAKEIKELIGASAQSVEAGSSIVRNAESSMREIVRHVQQVASLIGEIATSVHQQDAGIGQVNQAVSHTDQVTQQNAALVEQTAAAASSLNQQTEELRMAVSSFEFG